MADRLEQVRQQQLTQLDARIQAATNVTDTHAQRGRAADAALLARIRQIADLGRGTAGQHKELRSRRREDHKLALEQMETDKVLAESDVGLNRERYAALQQTRILNTSARLYPQLFPDPPLQHAARKQKLYVLGHGAPDQSRLFSTPGGAQSMSAPELAAHLKSAGLPGDFTDLRLTSCQGALPVEDERERQRGVGSGYLAPALFQATRKDFPHMSVTGYAGDGVTFPFDSDSHLRSEPGNAANRVRRKSASVRYPAL
jgi:hypothetical protein